MSRRKKFVAVAGVIAILAALVALTIPQAHGQPVVHETKGRVLVTYTQPGGTGQDACSAQGEVVDTNNNELPDSLRGRAACSEVRGVRQNVIFSSIVEVFRSGAWQHALVNPTDAFSPTQPAFVLSYTPTARFCPYNVPMQSYRVVNNSRSIWDNGTASNHTTISQTFQWNMLTNDPRCVAPAGPTTSSTTSTTAVPRANLDLSISHNPPSPLNGERVDIPVTVTNSGTAAASGAVATIDLPDSLTGVVADVPTGTCTVGAGNVVTCTLGTLDVGETNIIAIHANGGAVGTFPVSATLTSTTAGVGTATASDSITFRAAADLSLDKSITAVDRSATTPGVQVFSGDTVQYSFAVRNSGPNDATSVFVVDNWPAALGTPTVVSGSCALNAADELRCTFGDVAAGGTETAVVRATVSAAAGTTVTNTATTESTQDDPDTVDRSDQVTVNVIATPAP